MSSRPRRERVEEGPSVPHPRENLSLVGHAAAEQTLLAAYRSGRVPHAWLITGPAGIGKATLAYRFARFVLANPDPAAPPVQAATSLAVSPDAPAARRIAAATEGGLLVLERTTDDKGKLRTVISVDQVRDTVGFFGATATGGGWRVCLVDVAEELKFPEGANALLKILEEPPQRALLLLVSHSPGRLLPTIRSRCRVLALRPLGVPEVVAATGAALGAEPDDPALVQAAEVSDGCVARAIQLSGGPMLALRQQVTGLLEALPRTDPRALHALGDTLERADRAVVDVFAETVRDWMTAELHRPPQDVKRLAPLAEAWAKIDDAVRETQILNLERRPLVFAVFGWLAEAARG
ncbi:DNA polymerase III delta prime subunit [Rhodovulum sp. PH10]|uniref:DNA polymerase III subunit delta' n=1 Tax=Rhodovulum sp. PH10 TaxID=1187851 RepID=UPI00027C2C0A|nr:DNA polymerase III subunit delta' [Rhodovulum sp. PH10]EJW12081.1 DNA polymerase III delta prime subunit [Rhodovulum sp. PH10]